MYLLYSILLTIGVIALLPRFVIDALRHGKYAAGFRERLGRLPPLSSSATRGRPIIWLHCVSVGETQAARPLARALLGQYPSHALVVSTTTLTGQRIARELFSHTAATIFYFPFDWSSMVRRALRAINPSVVLVMETELWPNFLRECRVRRVPVVLINGRISENSFRRYKLIKGFISRVVNDLALAIMQTGADAERIRTFGLSPERVKVSGNIKFDAEIEVGEHTLTGEMRARFEVDERRPLLVAASTHAPEDRIVLEAFKRVRDVLTDRPPRLLIAPRHPERFAKVASLLDASSLRWARRSASPTAEDAQCDAILLDTIGELRAVYPLAEIVFVGGSIAPVGGHNVLEPAGASKCNVTGAHTSNFDSIVRGFLERGALVQLPHLTEAEAPSALARAFENLLGDDEQRRRIGENARCALDQNRGASARTLEMLMPLLNSRQYAGQNVADAIINLQSDVSREATVKR